MSMTVGNLDHRDEAPVQLISGVLSDARDLAVAEVDKLRAEAKEVGEEVKIAGVGALILMVAAMLLGVALSLGLAQLGLPAWSAFAIVGTACAACGAVFVVKRRAIAKAT
jgi:hypothetical protein